MPFSVLRLAVPLGLVAMLASLGIHMAILLGRAVPRVMVPVMVVVTACAALPVLIALIQRAEAELDPPTSLEEMLTHGFRMNAWMFRLLSVAARVVFGGLLVYTVVQFGLEVVEVLTTQPLPDGFSLRVISAFCLYFSGFSLLFGRPLIRLGPVDEAQ